MTKFLEPIVQWYQDQLVHYGYPLIVLLMAAESSILPVPSEAIIPFAAMQGKFSFLGIVAAGTLGSWIGATIMYWVARTAGRPLILRYGGYVLIPPAKVEGAERWAAHFGAMGIFISRLLPVVRHLIGIPAGIVRMDFRLYSLYTILGSAIWCSILCWLGIRIGKDRLAGEYRHIVILLSLTVVVIGTVYYFFVHRHMKSAPPTGTK